MKPGRREEVNVIDQDGYEVAKRPKKLAQFMPDIFAVDAAGSEDSVAKELSRPKSPELKPTMEKSTK